jgi:pyridinium-3,5-biscarboxylic acid mononucleotide sulfurtransferase
MTARVSSAEVGSIVLNLKFEKLKEVLASYESVLVAFSGGCDSALVAKVACDVLGPNKTLAVTAKSESLPEQEVQEVEDFVRAYKIKHQWITTHELEKPEYAANPINRCYFCKTELYQFLIPIANEIGFKAIVNGVNVDDLGDWRPGLKAAKEYNVKSPLVEAGLIKSEIRELSQQLGLSTWNKPAAACLSSRFPYGHAITSEKLRQVDRGEELLKSYGFKIVRLRHYGNSAKIELGPEELDRYRKSDDLSKEIKSKIRNLGFEEVELDPEGYRQGKLNTHLQTKV